MVFCKKPWRSRLRAQADIDELLEGFGSSSEVKQQCSLVPPSMQKNHWALFGFCWWCLVGFVGFYLGFVWIMLIFLG